MVWWGGRRWLFGEEGLLAGGCRKVAEPGGAPAQLFFLRLAISVQLTLAVSGKGKASADIWFGQITRMETQGQIRDERRWGGKNFAVC